MDLFKYITDRNTEAQVIESIDETIPDYLDDDWETEFDDIHEAYLEQGRGEAESHVLWVMIRNASTALEQIILDDEYCDLFDKLAEHWNLNTN